MVQGTFCQGLVNSRAAPSSTLEITDTDKVLHVENHTSAHWTLHIAPTSDHKACPIAVAHNATQHSLLTDMAGSSTSKDKVARGSAALRWCQELVSGGHDFLVSYCGTLLNKDCNIDCLCEPL